MSLTPVAEEQLTLSTNTTVAVPVAKPVLKASQFPNIWGYGRKPVVDHDGEALFAEIAILRLLRDEGWDGVWVDSWKSRCWSQMPGAAESEFPQSKLLGIASLERHLDGLRKYGGVWDIVAWKDGRVLFCDAKRTRKDSIKPNQIAWLEKRLDEGAKPSDFLIAEWVEDVLVPPASTIKGSIGLKVRTGKWYGWHMFPGYSSLPYSSPILVRSVGPARSPNRLTIDFVNIGYAEGVQDFCIELSLSAWGDSYLAGTYDDESGRMGVVTALTPDWLSQHFPRSFEVLPALRDAATAEQVASTFDAWHRTV